MDNNNVVAAAAASSQCQPQMASGATHVRHNGSLENLNLNNQSFFQQRGSLPALYIDQQNFIRREEAPSDQNQPLTQQNLNKINNNHDPPPMPPPPVNLDNEPQRPPLLDHRCSSAANAETNFETRPQISLTQPHQPCLSPTCNCFGNLYCRMCDLFGADGNQQVRPIMKFSEMKKIWLNEK